MLLNRSDSIVDVSGLTVEQIEMIEKLVVSFREHNQMRIYIEKNDNDRDRAANRIIRYFDFVNNPRIFDEK